MQLVDGQVNNLPFQFPSNGIVVPNQERRDQRYVSSYLVSIPFKRDSSSELLALIALMRMMMSFQFPSNGIVVPNKHFKHKPSYLPKVSIPFKRDSSSEQGWGWGYNKEAEKVSIPFKRDSSSEQTIVKNISIYLQFQFPSNGIVVPNF